MHYSEQFIHLSVLLYIIIQRAKQWLQTVRHLPPPFWWQRYGNLHTLPRPTLNPTWANTYWTFESHAGRSSSDVSTPSGLCCAVSWLSERPSPSQALSSLLSSGGFSVLVLNKDKEWSNDNWDKVCSWHKFWIILKIYLWHNNYFDFICLLIIKTDWINSM